MSFDACMARDWPGISDKKGFCAEMERGNLAKRIDIKIRKVDIDKRIVTAITNILTDGHGNDIVDKQGDVIKADNLEDVFIDSFANGGSEMGGVMHERDGGVDVVQHFVFTKRDWEAMDEVFGRDLKHMPEFGIVKFKVTSDSIWEDVKAGRYPEVSIEGAGTRTDL